MLPNNLDRDIVPFKHIIHNILACEPMSPRRRTMIDHKNKFSQNSNDMTDSRSRVAAYCRRSGNGHEAGRGSGEEAVSGQSHFYIY